jgi:hypothetical protein
MDGTRQEEYPHLFSFAKNKEISFADAYSNNNGSIYVRGMTPGRVKRLERCEHKG